MGMQTLYRRLAALEKSRAITEETCNMKMLHALHKISRENLELLIDVTLALRLGRELTAREAAARQAYAAVLESECRLFRGTVRRFPDTPELISQAVLRQKSEDDLLLCIRGFRALEAGVEPTAAQKAAIESHFAAEEAQYQRAGFSSKTEFERWLGDHHPAPTDRDRATMGR